MNLRGLDEDIFLFLNGNHNDFLDIATNWASNLLLWIPLALITGYILLKNFNVESRTRLILNIILIFIIAILHYIICVKFLPTVFYGFAPRSRPYYDPAISELVRIVGEQCDRQFGFFGPRPCLAFSVATFLSFSIHNKFKWFKVLLFLWAIFISYSRVYIGVHFPGNVLASGMIGMLIGFLLYRGFFYVKNSLLAI
jgi:undecaprenyl-diphosphatase